jgi:hypothetical protein
MRPTTVGADSARRRATSVRPASTRASKSADTRAANCSRQVASQDPVLSTELSASGIGDAVIPARRGILAPDRDLDHLGSHALVAVRAALRQVIRVGAGSAGKRPLIPSRWRREAINPDAILDRATQIRCSVRNTRCIKSDHHPRRIGREDVGNASGPGPACVVLGWCGRRVGGLGPA